MALVRDEIDGIDRMLVEKFVSTYKNFFAYFTKMQADFNEKADEISFHVMQNHLKSTEEFFKKKNNPSVEEVGHYITQLYLIDYANEKPAVNKEVDEILRKEFESLKNYYLSFKEDVTHLARTAMRGKNKELNQLVNPNLIEITAAEKVLLEKAISDTYNKAYERNLIVLSEKYLDKNRILVCEDVSKAIAGVQGLYDQEMTTSVRGMKALYHEGNYYHEVYVELINGLIPLQQEPHNLSMDDVFKKLDQHLKDIPVMEIAGHYAVHDFASLYKAREIINN